MQASNWNIPYGSNMNFNVIQISSSLNWNIDWFLFPQKLLDWLSSSSSCYFVSASAVLFAFRIGFMPFPYLFPQMLLAYWVFPQFPVYLIINP